MFVTIDGGEGCGKTTQAAKLSARLSELRNVQLTREPGGTVLGGKIRTIVQDPLIQISPIAELLLFAADRAEHVGRVIRPALERGDIVVCDRFVASTVAYQGYGRGIDLDWIKQINAIACNGLKPDLSIWLDVPVAIGMARSGRDRIESESMDFFERVRSGFTQMERNGQLTRIDGTGTEDEVFERLKAAIESNPMKTC